MGAYLIKRLLLIIPTLFGIMVINFAIIQIVPGGPVEQMIAQMTGTAVESTARFSGGGEGETLEFNRDNSTSVNDSKYRGAQGLDPDVIKEIEKMYGMDKPAHQRFIKMLKDAKNRRNPQRENPGRFQMSASPLPGGDRLQERSDRSGRRVRGFTCASSPQLRRTGSRDSHSRREVRRGRFRRPWRSRGIWRLHTGKPLLR